MGFIYILGFKLLLNMGAEAGFILSSKPDRLEYVEKLLKYEESHGWLDKIQKVVKRKRTTRSHSISEWCKILGKSKTNPQVRDFLQKLIEKNILIENGERKTGAEHKVYKLDKDRLENLLYNSSYYAWHRDIFFRVVNNQEPNKKIVTDI